MSSSTSKEALVAALAPLFKAAGFSKTRSTWYRRSPDVIEVFKIQGSQFGPEYYVNIGIFLNALGAEERPPHYRCHVRQRLSTSFESPDVLFALASVWFETYGSIGQLRKLITKSAPYPTI